jgi:lipopolysaccharide/colanic/teichoic acid biosynthesis glycosyltransferase
MADAEGWREEAVVMPPEGAFSRALSAERDGGLAAPVACGEAVSGDQNAVHAVLAFDVAGSSHWLAEALYRAFEIVIAAIGIIMALPVMLVEAALIRLDSPGPVLFFQMRPGRSIKVHGHSLEGRPDLVPPPCGYDPDLRYYVPSYFQLVKFRTMFHDARRRFPELYSYNFPPEEFHQRYGTNQNDPRVTRIGSVLRRLSIDELPNLWCVLRGDMRLVGPRPEHPQVLRYYTPEEMYKFACKPGMTGLAQINGRGLLNWGETLAWDLTYVRTRTVWLDLKIIVATVKQVVTRRGAF